MAIELGLTSYRCRLHGGVFYYVGYDAISGHFVCKRYLQETDLLWPFPGGDTMRLITMGVGEAYPGFDVMRNGWLVVDIPIDASGNAERWVSKTAGHTWEEEVDS